MKIQPGETINITSILDADTFSSEKHVRSELSAYIQGANGSMLNVGFLKIETGLSFPYADQFGRKTYLMGELTNSFLLARNAGISSDRYQMLRTENNDAFRQVVIATSSDINKVILRNGIYAYESFPRASWTPGTIDHELFTRLNNIQKKILVVPNEIDFYENLTLELHSKKTR